MGPGSRGRLAESKYTTLASGGITFFIERKDDDTHTTKDVKRTKSFIVRVEACS